MPSRRGHGRDRLVRSDDDFIAVSNQKGAKIPVHNNDALNRFRARYGAHLCRRTAPGAS
jgi:hypothetical protein